MRAFGTGDSTAGKTGEVHWSEYQR